MYISVDSCNIDAHHAMTRCVTTQNTRTRSHLAKYIIYIIYVLYMIELPLMETQAPVQVARQIGRVRSASEKVDKYFYISVPPGLVKCSVQPAIRALTFQRAVNAGPAHRLEYIHCLYQTYTVPHTRTQTRAESCGGGKVDQITGLFYLSLSLEGVACTRYAPRSNRMQRTVRRCI